MENTDIFEKIHLIRHQLDYFGRSAPQTNQRSFRYAISRNPDKADIINALEQGSFPFIQTKTIKQ